MYVLCTYYIKETFFFVHLEILYYYYYYYYYIDTCPSRCKHYVSSLNMSTSFIGFVVFSDHNKRRLYLQVQLIIHGDWEKLL